MIYFSDNNVILLLQGYSIKPRRIWADRLCLQKRSIMQKSVVIFCQFLKIGKTCRKMMP